jgi:maltose O-acetyltransferase
MKTEKEKMLNGEWYLAHDPELVNERNKARLLFHRYNQTIDNQQELRAKILDELLGTSNNVFIEPPFYCDYGYNIHFGENVFLNFNCVILDVMKVEIGHDVLIGPGVQINTPTHPMDWKARKQMLEFAKPIRIGSNVWIGSGAIVCPGVTIGDRSVIGAGSIVTKDIPPDVVAVGNPCKVIKKLK